LTRIGAYENQDLKIADVGVTFFRLGGFWFSVFCQKQKQKPEISPKFQIGP